jgi:ankyrin repeat protein
LAQIYLGLLNDKVTPKKVRQALAEFQGQASGEGQMGKQLTNAYDQTMARIMGQEQGFRDLAKEVLMWITCAEEPLATVTLQHALAVEKNATKLSEDNFTDVSVIVSVCGGLVTVNEQNGIVRLVHYTAQEYFEHAQEIWFPDAQSDITQACVTYLSFSAFVSRACSTPLEIHIKRLLRTYPLYRYAVCNWGNHARKSSRLDGVVKEFLGCEAKIHATSQALLVAKTDNRAMTQSLCGLSLGPTWTAAGLHGLHLAATFGLHEAVTLLLHLNLNARDYFGRTPLTIAAEAGQTVFVKVLLDTRQAEVDSKDSFDRTPLSWAAQGGHNATVKLLLVNQAEVNSEDRSGRTPLAWATLGGYEATVSLLLAVSQVKIDLKDSCGLTPLSWAAIGGYEAIVKALLATGQVNINSKDQYNGMTPLGYAAQGGHENALKVLLASQAEADTKDTYGQTPLSWAASDGYEEIVKLLVGTGQVQVNSKDIGGQTPLTWAARGGHEGTIRILLATHRVEVDSKDNNGRTALSWAAQGGHEVTVKLLLATGQAKIDSKDRDGETPLSWAAQGGHEATVKLLVGSQAEGLSKNAKDQTLFNWAAMTGHEATVRLIREFGNAAGIWSAAPVEE